MLTGSGLQGWLSRKNGSSLLREILLGIVVALIPERAIKASLGSRVASGAATTGTGGVRWYASWPLTGVLLVALEALAIACRGVACFLLR